MIKKSYQLPLFIILLIVAGLMGISFLFFSPHSTGIKTTNHHHPSPPAKKAKTLAKKIEKIHINPDLYASVLVLDLNDSGIKITPLASSKTFFDIDEDGFKEKLSWIDDGDGLLCLDRNGNGVIDNVAELFGHKDSSGVQISGFDELLAADQNKDKKISTPDPIFSRLQLWQDINRDGKSQPEEVNPLSAYNITEIDLTHITKINEKLDDSYPVAYAHYNQKEKGIITQHQIIDLNLNVNQSNRQHYEIIPSEETPSNQKGNIAAAKFAKMKVSDIPLSLLEDKAFVLSLLKINVFAINDIPSHYRDDPEILLQTTNLVGSLRYASDRLKDDKDFVKKMLAAAPNGNFRAASDRLKQDPEIINYLLAHGGTLPIEEIPSSLLSKELIIRAVQSATYPRSLQYKKLPPVFKKDKEILEAFLKGNYAFFDEADETIKNDEAYVLTLVKKHPKILTLDFELKSSPSFKAAIAKMIADKTILFDKNVGYPNIPFLNLIYFADFALDDGKQLKLKLKDGSYKTLTYRRGEKTGHSEIDYYIPSFLGYLQEFGFYVVGITGWEFYQVLLINDKTGEEAAEIHGFPHFNPKRNYFTYAKSVDAYNFTGVEIFSIKPYEVKSVFRQGHYGNEISHWIDDDSFFFKSVLGERQEDLIVRNTTDGWQIISTKTK